MSGVQVVPIPACPKGQLCASERFWYKLPAAPNADVCSRCYHDHLSQTPFAGSFKLDYDDSMTGRSCDFSTPHVLAVLRQALEQGDLAPLRDYIVRRSGIKPCKGGGIGAKAEEGYTWRQLRDPSMAGKFAACAACYEDYVVPAGFSPHFEDAPVAQPPDSLWSCDIGFPFMVRLTEQCRDWKQALAWGLHRLQLPVCGGMSEVDGASRAWYQLRDPNLNLLWVCEACFLDIASMTFADGQFYRVQHALPQGTNITCFAGGHVPLRIALNVAMERRDFNIFLRAASAIVRSPPCRPGGFQSTWYSLVPPAEEVDVCATCYAGLFEATGFGGVLAPKPVPAAEPRACNMHVSTPGSAALLKRLDAAIDRREPAVFVDFARRFSEVPGCPGAAVVTGRRWYRHDMFSCCPACWLEAPIEGTALAGAAFPVRDALEPGHLRCDFYSARVRGLWRSACAQDDLPGFVAFMARRLEVWKQTYPAIQRALAQMRLNAERQATLLMSSTILHGANNISALAGAHGNYGGAGVGWGYETVAGAQGAADWNQAMGMYSASAGPAAVIAQMTGLWESVE
ncbi:uncharacterized protein E0L32_009021 [Thyridium curvatum]|uniref:Integral membrane protein n=1 Tax=Thyridium curvatum TaxID=1093900 RepID=A0A507AZZ6_9PEZI|nr:uncharacterized protein E0L32_009021 [Thyridium curvatum]TPX09830.1 hypothetical protein E0L32_009021 [Thyridium curvatum]